ncbi:MAG: VWA domain-containing protein [bacterium]|nr:VWA domain-containing protein [bacterium]
MTQRLPILWLVALVAASTSIAAASPCPPAVTLAVEILEGSVGWGKLPVRSIYRLDEALLADEGRLRATVAWQLDGPALGELGELDSTSFCATLIVDDGGELVAVHEQSFEVSELADPETRKTVAALRYQVRVDLPAETSQMLVLLRHAATDLWGAAVVDDSAGDPIPPPGSGAVRLAGRDQAWVEVIHRGSRSAAPRQAAPGTVVRLVPPRNQPVTGSTRFDALAASDAVDKVVFFLDGKQIEVRKRKPYVARIGLASPPRAQTVRAVAYDSQDRELGEDTLIVNQLDVPFRVRITGMRSAEVAGAPAMEVTAEVTLPADARLDRVEFYRNDQLITRLKRPPFRSRIPTPEIGPEDYLLVVATLADGSSIDDVVLLAGGPVEEVAVNLVELHVVAGDADERPVKDLRPEEFVILHRGVPAVVESFAYADDVPLVMGVVIDTSGSMELVMHDTRRAAARFLGQTVLPQDRAFVVDFDIEPRLLQGTTGDMTRLLLSLGKLQAEGRTAMYDAIVFSMLQFEKESGRKALVVLTDGDDLDSRYGPRYCAEFGRKLGVPIYIIGLGGLDSLRRTYRKSDLRKVTSQTGGRLYFVDSLDELAGAYAEINAELRSQYSLTFYTDSDLSDEERRGVEVRIKRPGLSARTVVGSRRATP